MLSCASSVALRSSAGKSLFTMTAVRSYSVLSGTTFPLVATANQSSLRKQQQQQQQQLLLQQQQKKQLFSSDSHSDFAPKKKEVSGDDDEALDMVKSHVEGNKIMLYMKGNPSIPLCGFSATVAKILQREGADFSSVNVLDYPAIREAVKKFSDWPTIPQLYINGEFIGGCDIITAMHESGELKEVLDEVTEEK